MNQSQKKSTNNNRQSAESMDNKKYELDLLVIPTQPSSDKRLSSPQLKGAGGFDDASSGQGLSNQGQPNKIKKKIIKIHYTNGDIYEGHIDNLNQRDGWGTYVCADKKKQSGYEFTGNWKGNLREGKNGQCFYYNEEFYIGDWMHDQRHGQGEHFYNHKEQRYIGDWRHDMRYGKGVLISNGSQGSGGSNCQQHYEGRFREDQKHGRGILKLTQNYQRYSTKQIEVKIYEQDYKKDQLVFQKKLQVVVGEDQIQNLMLNTDQFSKSIYGGYDMYSLSLLQIYARNQNGELNYIQNLQKYMQDRMINYHINFKKAGLSLDADLIICRDPKEVEKEQKEKERGQDHNREQILNRIIGYNKLKNKERNQGHGQNKEEGLTVDEADHILTLDTYFQSEPEFSRKWSTADLLSFLLHSPHSPCFNQKNYKQFQIIIDTFIEFKVDGTMFFNFQSEAEILQKLGDNVKALGIRKNFMRIIRKFKAIEDKITQQNILLSKRKETIIKRKNTNQLEVEESPQGSSARRASTKDFTENQQLVDGFGFVEGQPLSSCKSQNNGQENSGFQWPTNISQVHDAASGAMSALSALIWNNQNSESNNKEEQKSEQPNQNEDLSPNKKDIIDAEVEKIQMSPETNSFVENTKNEDILNNFNQASKWEGTDQSSVGVTNDYQTQLNSNEKLLLQIKDIIEMNQEEVLYQPQGVMDGKKDTEKQNLNSKENSQNVSKLNEVINRTALPNRPMSSSTNSQFLKEKVGKIGKIQGINVQKLRDSHIKTNLQNSINSEGQNAINNLQFRESKSNANFSIQQDIGKQFSTNTNDDGRRELRLAKNLNRNNSVVVPNPNRESFGQYYGIRKQFSTKQSQNVKDEQQMILKIEKYELKKQIQMSKNLIDVLFKTDADREREKLKREKEKLKQGKTSSIAGVSSGLNITDNGNSSQGNGGGNYYEKSSPVSEEDNNKLDEDAYEYLVKTFRDNGFSFYIDFNDIKWDYKTDYLGGGGYGEVFKAQWMGATVAVKRFGRKCVTKKSINDFVKEIEIVNKMRHPNIIFYMGVTFDEHKHYYMITEYSSRGSIFDLLHGQNNTNGAKNKVILQDFQIFKIIKEMALAIQYLHTRKILHCDLKSQNILLTEDWSVKICDFGLARYKEKFVRENHGKVGTPHWMAPEILRGEKYTESADVYSFGVILWELVTGQIPHRGRSVPQIVGSVGYNGEKLKLPQSMSHDNSSSSHPSINRHLKRIINSCTTHDVSARPNFIQILQYISKIETQYQQQNQQLLDQSETKTYHTDKKLIKDKEEKQKWDETKGMQIFWQRIV